MLFVSGWNNIILNEIMPLKLKSQMIPTLYIHFRNSMSPTFRISGRSEAIYMVNSKCKKVGVKKDGFQN